MKLKCQRAAAQFIIQPVKEPRFWRIWPKCDLINSISYEWAKSGFRTFPTDGKG